MNSPEIKEIPRVDRINKYLNESIEEIKFKLKSVGENKEVQWEELNKVFLEEIDQHMYLKYQEYNYFLVQGAKKGPRDRMSASNRQFLQINLMTLSLGPL